MNRLKFCSVAAIVAVFYIIFSAGCKKESFITSPDALMRLSEDTLHFDTVFTTTGSTTQYFKIYNQNNQKLLLSSLQLMGGNASFFKMNIDGLSGTNLTNIEIEPNDSIYGFVTVKIDPTTANLPFIVRDSIKIQYNGNTRFMQLEAFGQNAIFLSNRMVTRDTTWTNNLPIVVLGALTVNEGRTLTINKGTKVYLHADAPLIVNGTLQAVGEKFDSTRITFQSDRIDEPYRNYPGSWPGIYFTTKSINNFLQYCVLKNAYQGIIAENPSTNNVYKVTLDKCILDNIYDVAIGATYSSIAATNCLVSNCGFNLYIQSGGDYIFNNCTFASYGNNFVEHKNAAVTITNSNATNDIRPLNLLMQNSIVYGEGGIVDDEIVVVKKPTTLAFTATLNNVLYKVKTNISADATVNAASKKNQLPQFDSIDVGKRFYNFRLKSTSPAINAGIVATGLDLDGNNRNVNGTDLGCYEKQP